MNPLVYACAALLALAGVLGWSGDRARSALKLCQEERKTAVATSEADAFREAADRAGKIAKLAAEDRIAAAAQAEHDAQRAQALATSLRARLRELPAPQCAPGQARVDAWNEVTR